MCVVRGSLTFGFAAWTNACLHVRKLLRLKVMFSDTLWEIKPREICMVMVHDHQSSQFSKECRWNDIVSVPVSPVMELMAKPKPKPKPKLCITGDTLHYESLSNILSIKLSFKRYFQVIIIMYAMNEPNLSVLEGMSNIRKKPNI